MRTATRIERLAMKREWDNKVLITFAPEATLLNTANKCFKSQQQELKGILIPDCTVKCGENAKK